MTAKYHRMEIHKRAGAYFTQLQLQGKIRQQGAKRVGERHEVLNVAWESRTSPVISESSSEKDCFLRFRTWLELMQLRINNERAVVILMNKSRGCSKSPKRKRKEFPMDFDSREILF